MEINSKMLSFFVIILLFFGSCKEQVSSILTTNDDKFFSVGDVSFVMKKIPKANKVILGDNSDDQNKEHTVTLSPYNIGQTEVTQELWQAVMKNNPSYFDGSEKKKPEEGEVQSKRPVEKISWFMAIVFCNELTKASGMGEQECVYYSDKAMTKVYTSESANNIPFMNMMKKGFRLPTEAEWEWAAMGATKSKYTGTNENLQDYAWFSDNANNKTHEVKKKKPNGYGIYDMSGNVWEWCWDWYSEPIDTSKEEDPTGGDSGMLRVWKGASYADMAEDCAPYFRASFDPEFDNGRNIGIRLVCR